MLSWVLSLRGAVCWPNIKTMKVINVHRLMLQFDADQVTQGTKDEQARQAIDQINALLQREPFGLAAQFYATPDEIEVEQVNKEEE